MLLTNQDAPATTVLALALKTASHGPMREVTEVEAIENMGLVGMPKPSRKRGITILSMAQWTEVQAELGCALPWYTRRANVLVDHLDFAPLIGRTVRMGEVLVEIGGETRPCSYMEELFPGLEAALQAGFRGGAYGRITQGGRIVVGDGVWLVEQ